MVKADAYGHGALEVSRVLCGEGARWLAVSSVEEGVNLRCGGIRDPRILVMGGFLPYEGEALVEYDLTPAVHSLDQIREVDRLAAASREAGPLSPQDRFRYGPAGHARRCRRKFWRPSAECRHAQLEGLMTHFASAADYTSPQTDQPARLLPRDLPPTCSAPGVKAARTAHLQHQRHRLRPARGLAQHGARRSRALRLRLAGARRSPRATAGRRTGAHLEGQAAGRERYSRRRAGGLRRHRSARRGPCASASWARATPTAFFTACPNRGKVIADGKLTPILGTISMDLTTIDLSHTTALGAGRRGDAARRRGRSQPGCAADRPGGRHHFLQHSVQHQRPRAARVRIARSP